MTPDDLDSCLQSTQAWWPGPPRRQSRWHWRCSSSALRAGGSRWGCGSDLAQPTGAALPAHRRPRV